MDDEPPSLLSPPTLPLLQDRAPTIMAVDIIQRGLDVSFEESDEESCGGGVTFRKYDNDTGCAASWDF